MALYHAWCGTHNVTHYVTSAVRADGQAVKPSRYALCTQDMEGCGVYGRPARPEEVHKALRNGDPAPGEVKRRGMCVTCHRLAQSYKGDDAWEELGLAWPDDV